MAFLFTDIEGSTALLRQLGARGYAEALAEHDRILRDAVEGSGGSVVDTQGDAFFAAFRDTAAAVDAAVSAQYGLAQSTWPEGGSVRVRMGVHAGVPEIAGGRYLGLDVHLAARICAVAHGGQVVVSQAVADSISGHDADRAIEPLGEYRLKDFDAPLALFQVSAGGLPHDFPALRSGGPAGGVGGFAGREEELAEAAAFAIAKAARRAERRRILAGIVVVAVLVAVPALYFVTRPTPVRVVGDSVAILDSASGHVVGDVPLESPPTGLAAGAGAVWVISGRNATLTRIDQQTLKPETSAIPFDKHGPTDVAAGDDGRVWVVNGLDRSVSVLTPNQSHPALHVRLPRDVGVLGIGVAHIAVTPNAVWVDNGGAAGVSRLSPTSGEALGPATQDVPTGAIAAGAGGVWVGAAVNYFGDGVVALLNPATGRNVAIFNVGEVDGLAVGFGHAWVADAADGTVERLNPTTNRDPSTPVPGQVSARIPVGKGVQSIAIGDGLVWAANPLQHTIDGISPVDRKVVRHIPISGRPTSLVEHDRRLYVTVAPSPPAVQGGGVRVAISPSDIDAVDPATTSQAVMWQIDYAAGLNLVRLKDANGAAGRQIVPDAAKSWRVSNQGYTYTFTIRRGLEFSPPWNQPVTAKTFKDSFEREIETGSPLGSFLGYALKGAAAFLANRRTHISGIHAHGYTLSMTWLHQGGLIDFLSLLALPYASAVPIGWTGPGIGGSVPSAGPYYIRSYTPHSQLILTRNPHYHGPRQGHIAEYTFVESAHPWAMLANNHAGYTPDSPPARQIGAQLRRFGPGSPAAKAGHQQVFVDPSPSTVYMTMHTSGGPFRNPLVRRAINEAIDRPALAATYGPREATVTDQYLPPAIPGFPGNGHVYPLTEPDIPAARRLIRRAHVHLPLNATLFTSSGSGALARARILRRDLARIGILLSTHSVSRSLEAQAEHVHVPYPLIDDGYSFPTPDAAAFLVGKPANWGEGPYFARFEHADQLPRAHRRAAFGRLDLALARHYAPLAAYAYLNHIDYFSDRLTGQLYQPYFGIDLTKLALAR